MSDYLPFEIQAEIINRLPVKSVIRFRSFSKAWKSLIDTSDFIAHYTGHQRLLVRYDHLPEKKYVSIADDNNNFPQNKLSITIPLLVKNWLKHYSIIGCSHGLLCLYGVPGAVLWNPSIRKAVGVIVPDVADGTVIGFGVCRETLDPKIVKINDTRKSNNVDSLSCIPWRVEVFTLSKGIWRSPYSGNGNLPRKSIERFDCQVAVDGILYWLATYTATIKNRRRPYNLLISFDLTSEEFSEVNLPDRLSYRTQFSLSMFKLRESLVILQGDVMFGPHTATSHHVTDVWIMENSVSKSFTKLFTVNLPTPYTSVMGFRNSGEPILEITEHHHQAETAKLAVYEPSSKHISDLEINGKDSSYDVYPYMETLTLFDQPDFTVYNAQRNG